MWPFLSTPSARRATAFEAARSAITGNFYPRPPRGGRRYDFEHQTRWSNFYPRPPRGGRLASDALHGAGGPFLSTPSARRATYLFDGHFLGLVISIHALREEGDGTFAGLLTCPRYFYPRPPRGGRPERSGQVRYMCVLFLSTPSARRATLLLPRCISSRPPRGGRHPIVSISIHALREEGDSKNGEKHLRFCFIIKRSAQIWKSLSKNIRKNSCDLHRMA